VSRRDRYLVVLADREPHRSHVLAGLERFIGAPVAQRGDDLVASYGIGVQGAELLPHPFPEDGQSHAVNGTS
jgi:hypothetical protein